MPRSENDTAVLPEERPVTQFSRSDLLIPITACAAVGVLLFFAFQPRAVQETLQSETPIADSTTKSLEKRQRTIEVAEALIRRDDVSLETANACLKRIATSKKKDNSTVCLQIIQDLPHELTSETQKRWANLLQQYVSKESLQGLILQLSKQQESRSETSTVRLAWSALVAKPDEQISTTFDWAAQDVWFMIDLLKAIPGISDRPTSEKCLTQIHDRILAPACRNSDGVGDRLILAAIDCVSQIQIDSSRKASVLCELALAGVCRCECFQHLQKLGAQSIPMSMRGSIAAALLDHLAGRGKMLPTVHSPETWAFAEELAEVFSGNSRQRFEQRLDEIRSLDLGHTASELHQTANANLDSR